jgi:hypothetical protein
VPRRGEYDRSYAPAAAAPAADRVGLRAVTCRNHHGEYGRCTFDPSAFACSRLAGELADEWAENTLACELGLNSARIYRRAISAFCAHVDATVPRPGRATLASADPDLHLAVTEWIRILPSRFPAGSPTPATLAGSLRTLVSCRIQHPDRPVAGHLTGWAAGSIGVSQGSTTELDEFTREEKRALVQAAWKDVIAIEARLREGWAEARSGADPRSAGWTEPANLLWAIAHHQELSIEEIYDLLPDPRTWPPQLTAFLPEGGRLPGGGKRLLLRALVRRLYLHNLDLHSFRILLMAATGHASEEITGLFDTDLDFSPAGVSINFTKDRANATRHRAFPADPDGAGAVLHPGKPRLDAAFLLTRLMDATRPAVERAGLSPMPLFLRTAVNGRSMSIRRFHPGWRDVNFAAWLKVHGVSVSHPADIRRLRKSGKVEKAIAYKGRVSDIADDHSAEVFRNHYAHGTTLRVISGQVITKAQQSWLDQALTGPVVITDQAQAALSAPDAREALGLSATQIAELQAGQMNMGVSSCRDPFDSPYGRPGQLCPVAPLRCLECRHAFVLPSNLPQLLLFAQHLQNLRNRLPPVHFHAVWGQSHTNLQAILEAHSELDIALARKQIAEDGITLQLPLAAHVEFDA